MAARALCVSDFTSEEACLGYLEAFIKKYTPKLVLLSGDVTQNGPVDYAEDVFALFERHKLPVVAVHGNNDPPRAQELIAKRSIYVHGRSEVVLGRKFAGVGGSNPTPFNTVCEYSEEQIAGFLKGKVDKDTIVVSHPAPKGIMDEVRPGVKIGSSAVLEMIERDQPRAVVCGHAHESEGEQAVGRTKVVKVAPLMHGKAVVLDLDTLNAEFVRV